MAGAHQVLMGALGRSKSGSSFPKHPTRTATVRQSNKDRAHGLATASAPNTHMMSGAGGWPQFPNATDEARTFRTFK